MLTYALFAFVVAAIAGLILASFVLRGNFAPWMLSLLHAAVGAAGLILLGFGVLQGADGRSLIAFGALLVAALAGFYLAFLHLREKVAPSGAVIGHAGAAVLGVVLLAGTILKFL